MRTRFIVFIAILSVMTSCKKAQPSEPPIIFPQIIGKVIGIAPDGRVLPILQSLVTLGDTKSDTTTQNGSFHWTNVEAGSYRLRVLSLLGKLLLDSTITLNRADTLLLRVPLSKEEADRFFVFPLAVGNEWTYEFTEQDRSGRTGTPGTKYVGTYRLILTGKGTQDKVYGPDKGSPAYSYVAVRQGTASGMSVGAFLDTITYPSRLNPTTYQIWETDSTINLRLQGFTGSYNVLLSKNIDRSITKQGSYILQNDTLSGCGLNLSRNWTIGIVDAACMTVVHNIGLARFSKEYVYPLTGGEGEFVLKSYKLVK